VCSRYDEVPSYPHQHPEFWNIWRALILRRVPVVDAVFTGEDYGNRLAAELGAQHVMMDRTHSAIPISARRCAPIRCATGQFIPAAVRPFLRAPRARLRTGIDRQNNAVPRTGGALQLRLGAGIRTCFLRREGHDSRSARRAENRGGQMAIEEEAALQANGVLFCDTDVLTTVLYARHYYETCPLWIERLAHERRYNLTLLTDIDLPWEPDVQRELGHRREEFYALFRGELESRRIPYVQINGNGRARLDAAIDAVENLLSIT
jgi:nicotinamide riboside kinase